MKALKINGYKQLVAENEEQFKTVRDITLKQIIKDNTFSDPMGNIVVISIDEFYITHIYGILVQENNSHYIYSNVEVNGYRHIISGF